MMLLNFTVFLAGFCSGMIADADDDHDYKSSHMDYSDILVKPKFDIPATLHTSHRHDNIVYPCKLNNLNCMRTFLATNSNCTIATGPVPEPLRVPNSDVEIFVSNLTISALNLRIDGLSAAKISEFYWNKATGKVVIAFNVRNLIYTFPTMNILFHRKANEPVSLTDYGVYRVPEATFTTILSSVPSLRLEGAEMLVYIDDGNIVYNMGPKFYESKDPDVVRELTVFETNLPLVANEFNAQSAALYNTVYIQNNLCDFGVSVN